VELCPGAFGNLFGRPSLKFAAAWEISPVSRVRAWLVPPPRDAGPQATLLWVRRIEILIGLAALTFGLLDWSQGWWHWLLIGLGLLGLSPWWGVARILRRADSPPEILNHDAERGYHRARRFLIIWLPMFIVAAAAIGYAYGRWLGAGINVVLIGGGARSEGGSPSNGCAHPLIPMTNHDPPCRKHEARGARDDRSQTRNAYCDGCSRLDPARF
jgi:hypothetical protein